MSRFVVDESSGRARTPRSQLTPRSSSHSTTRDECLDVTPKRHEVLGTCALGVATVCALAGEESDARHSWPRCRA